jgi:hypothetical protein
MGKKKQQRPGNAKPQKGGGGLPLQPLLGLAGACGLLAALYKPLLSLVPGPASTVEVCEFGPEADVKSIEQLMQRSTPCLVRGLAPDLHASLVGQLSPVALKTLPPSEMFLRVTEGDSHSRVMQHSNTNPKEKLFFDDTLQLTWPTAPYDGWAFKKSTVKELLSPPSGFSASFVQDASMLSEIMPKVTETADALMAAVCPYDCPDSIDKQAAIWMESRGLGQQLHAEPAARLVFHLHGDRHVVVAPPEEAVRHAHVHPQIHPNAQGQSIQSQLAWSSGDWDRTVAGYGLSHNDKTPPPRYNQTKETVAHMSSGDLLYLPAYWGQQPTAGMESPSLSLVVSVWPTAVGPEDRPGNRGPWGSILNPEHPDSKRNERQNKALKEALEKAFEGTETTGEKWVGTACPPARFAPLIHGRSA